MSKAKLSIVIPAYNAEKYITECLNSIVKQDCDNYELIVVDDGSSDNTGKICDKYEKCFNQVNIFHTKNNGVSSARNFGLEKAKGEYVWFVDSDDLVMPNSVKTISALLDKSELLIFGTEEFDKKNTVKRQYDDLETDNQYAISQMLSDTGVRGYLFNKVFRLDVIKKNHLAFDATIKNCEDLLFSVHYTSLVKRVKISNEILYRYRQRKNGAIHSKLNKNQSTSIDAFLAISKLVKNKDATNKAKALFVKAYYKYRPLLSEAQKQQYRDSLEKFKKSYHSFSKKDKMLIVGYRYFNPFMRILHLRITNGGSLYD